MNRNELKQLEQYQQESGLIKPSDPVTVYVCGACQWEGIDSQLVYSNRVEIAKVQDESIYTWGNSYNCPRCGKTIFKRIDPLKGA